MNLYVTSDRINTPTGGGIVTYHEREAMMDLGKVTTFSGDELRDQLIPWGADEFLSSKNLSDFQLAHFYSGTFSKTVRGLKEKGVKVTYTVAAHDIDLSRQEHEKLGIPFDYQHLNDSVQFREYTDGYRKADIIITPSRRSYETLRKQGLCDSIQIIPHGCKLPEITERQRNLPRTFTVGYLGAVGPDKGLIYLLQAWKKLAYTDAILKIGGRESNSAFMRYLVNAYGGGNVHLTGWYENVSDFYQGISLYVQPSVTEGFGIEVLEAMAHYRPVLCSEGAGAVDCVPMGCSFPIRDVDKLVEGIRPFRDKFCEGGFDSFWLENWRTRAENFNWLKIREKYKKVWETLL